MMGRGRDTGGGSQAPVASLPPAGYLAQILTALQALSLKHSALAVPRALGTISSSSASVIPKS